MQIRPYEGQDERQVVALWSEVLADSAPHNEPATALRQKPPAAGRGGTANVGGGRGVPR